MKTKNVISFFLIFTFACLMFSCSSKSESKQEHYSSSHSNYNDEENNTENSESDEDENEETNEYSSGCKFEDGTYSATVDYNNPETGYSATYTLDVDVEDCQVVQINFPNDGYLDEDHISYADLDEDGNASVDGEDGKTYEIHIDD